MVWFQCEDCGENLKKPKLLSHFRICSAYKLSCIDCGETFGQQSVQSHTQCVTEAEKYGPKGQGKAPIGTPAKGDNKAKQKPDVDINVGLSSRPPWHCSLCNTNATSKQTLLLHAEGKKHRAKARAFHASKQPPKPLDESVTNGKDSSEPPKGELTCNLGQEQEPSKDNAQCNGTTAENGSLASKKRRKLDRFDDGSDLKKGDDGTGDKSNGEVIQAKRAKAELDEHKQITHATVAEDRADLTSNSQGGSEKKIKWKKLITSILKSYPEGALKMKKLQKLVLKSIKESGLTQDESYLKEKITEKVNSSSKLKVDGKTIRLVVIS